MNSYPPANGAEAELVTHMAEVLWLARRAINRQDNRLEAIDSTDEQAAKIVRQDLNLYMRYQTPHQRSYQRHAAELCKLQSDREKAESGFVSQKHCEADQQRKQEKHEASTAYIKGHLEDQSLGNRLLLTKVTWPKRPKPVGRRPTGRLKPGNGMTLSATAKCGQRRPAKKTATKKRNNLFWPALS